MEPQASRWDAFLHVLIRPRLLVQGLIEYALAWFFTRSWFRLFAVNLPILVLLLAAAGLISYGASLSQSTLAQRYLEWIELELPNAMRSIADDTDQDKSSPGVEPAANEDPSADTEAVRLADSANASDQATQSDESSQADGAAEAEQDSSGNSPEKRATAKVKDGDAEEVTPYGELLLRRLLQLENSNSRAVYLVAIQLSGQGRLPQARQMMRRIAPENGNGFAPGHAWLAAMRIGLRESIRSPEELEVLENDLAVATKWPGVMPALVAQYANLLESQGKVEQAIAILDEASRQEPSLKVMVATMAAKHGQQTKLDRVTAEAKEEIRRRMEASEESVADLIQLANLFLLEGEPDKAIQAAQRGLKIEPDNKVLRRLISESFRMKYVQTAKWSGDSASVNLGFLDAALKADPTNAAVGNEVARLLALGQTASPELTQALESQLASGQATAVTHILLANRYLVENKLKEAVPHLELALRQAPNNLLVMNNLALCLARTDEQAIPRALELSNVTVRAEPQNPVFHDTLGDIRALSGDRLGAIDSYEASIGLGEGRFATRKKLADLYRELGMSDMASAQEAEIEKLQSASPVQTAEAEQSGES
jgi:tetratricopeptide (TPR) repeat protein